MAEDDVSETTQTEPAKAVEWRQAAYQSTLLPDAPSEPEAYQSAIVPTALPIELQAKVESSGPPPRLSEQSKLGLGLLAVAVVAGVGSDWRTWNWSRRRAVRLVQMQLEQGGQR